MKNILEDICNYKKLFVKQRKKLLSLSEIEKNCKIIDKPRGFHNALKNSLGMKFKLIAEVKKASPSAGLLFDTYKPGNIAKIYQKMGASCISILTDEMYFKGHDDDLKEVRKCIKLPCLRKDFIIDPYQVFESKLIGADAILLIMAALEDNLAREIEEIAIKLDLDILIEVHDENELQRALKMKSKLIGINNRNLKTLQTDTSTTKKLVPLIPKDYTIVSESGLKRNSDLDELYEIGVKCFLIGESLLKSDSIADATKNILYS